MNVAPNSFPIFFYSLKTMFLQIICIVSAQSEQMLKWYDLLRLTAQWEFNFCLFIQKCVR